MTYLSGVTGLAYEQRLTRMGVGLLIQPGTYSAQRVTPFPTWAADNGCYPPDRPWTCAKWARMLGAMHDLPSDVRARCLFALVPDVPFDHDGTLARFSEFAPIARGFGFPLAFAIQDNATVDTVPWQHFDVAFLAGSTEWKCGQAAYTFALEARGRDKWVHMGRVNSWDRLDWASRIGCDSSDGTFIRHGKPAHMLARVQTWLDQNQPRLSQKMATATG